MTTPQTRTRPVTPDRFLDQLAGVASEIASGATERDRQRRYPVDGVERLRDIRFWALTTPQQFGGLGFDQEVLVAAILTLAAADGSLGQIPQNHFSTIERLRLLPDSPQRNQVLAAVGSGAFLGNATAEPGDRPPGQAETTLRRDADGTLRLTGRKVYATGAILADLVSVKARDERGVSRDLVLPRKTPGLVVNDDWDAIGQRTTGSGSVEFHDVVVDPLQVLPALHDPRAVYRHSALNHIVHAAIDVGLAEGALREAVSLARVVHAGRGAPGREFRHDPLGVATLGELNITTWTARCAVETAARGLARLTDVSPLTAVLEVFYQVLQAKVVGARAALEVTSTLFDIGGSSATRPALGLDRYWRDARTHTQHDAVRWKPYALGRWLIDDQVADPWTLAHPLRDLAGVDQP